jgi:alpha-beta hydrolase superfamily lysophospholipase
MTHPVDTTPPPPRARGADHEEGLLEGAAGAQLHWQRWLPSGPPLAVVVLAHGVGEHSGRYEHVAARLTRVQYAVYALDHRGHGRSSGPRADIDRMEYAVEDLNRLVTLAASRHPDTSVHLLGHSMGGCIALAYAIRHQHRLHGLLLSSAAATLESAPRAARLGAEALSAVTPRAEILELDPWMLSRDEAVVRAYNEDPLVHHGKLPARTVAEIAAAVERLPDAVPALRLPVLIMAGTADHIVPPSGSRMVHARAGSVDRTLRMYDGLYHELFHEPEKGVVLGDVVAWLDARTEKEETRG